MNANTIYTETDNFTRITVKHIPEGRHAIEVFAILLGLKSEDTDEHNFTALSRVEAIALRDALTNVLEA
jgi:hypothetical protein